MTRLILVSLLAVGLFIFAVLEFAIVNVGVASHELELSLLNRDDRVKTVSCSLIQHHQVTTVVNHYPETEARFKTVDGNTIVLSITATEKLSPLLRRQLDHSCSTDTVLVRIEYLDGRIAFAPKSGWFPDQHKIEVDVSATQHE